MIIIVLSQLEFIALASSQKQLSSISSLRTSVSLRAPKGRTEKGPSDASRLCREPRSTRRAPTDVDAATLVTTRGRRSGGERCPAGEKPQLTLRARTALDSPLGAFASLIVAWSTSKAGSCNNEAIAKARGKRRRKEME
ncbi:hypothetical protein MTO96_000772 [Rhipicephalus appendiculatus]